MKIIKALYMGSLALTMCAVLSGCNTAKQEQEKTNKEKSKQDQSMERNTQWSYEGDTGPEHWGELKPEYKMCLKGQEQSPIDIKMDQTKSTDKTSKPIEMYYQQTAFSIENNGHSIEGKSNGSADYLTLGEERYTLKQFHFHTPSEHQFDGKHADMELHLVHQNDQKQLAVVGIMIKEGQKNEALAAMWESLPKVKNTKDDLQHAIDMKQLVPSEQSSIRYMGSLTTPPCTESVQWTVMRQEIEMSKEQIEAFRTLFPTNNRPVQPIHERGFSES
ncbi:carbonic anhydrase [Bacillus pseudomycoides]|uniref:carbonic anhydrase n=1 Tax=Bacillus pseudomycoides TaxID=64104 RepID=A0AA91VA86_9BACI|nr:MULTISPECIES: carbonic anhydrase family protein [Bacillus]PEB51129.1 carbonic anhydrase [Bacillus sp. AFS098217]PED81306.1 carbonic anhydrase [Bacillus pseudomycoides]PEU16696.1 carbonic anhydrase [Bacillus sp. AFS019443]PEU21570.1 carbonic anhydrase [Bacillus sp. AFS014408]PFW58775.1 carbonic anhydrase [Bacillus sp. AFS075034]